MAEVESSKTHFVVLGLGLEGQVLGFGLEASSPRKLACPRLEDSSIFWIVKILWSAWKNFLENVFLWRSLEKFLWRPFFFWRSPEKNFWRLFFRRTLAPVSLVLGLGLEPWVLDSTSDLDGYVYLTMLLPAGFTSRSAHGTLEIFATSFCQI